MKKIIKENKVLFVLSIIILICLVLIAVGLISYFYSEDDDVYGSRLDGIEDYPISESIDNDIKSLYESGVVDVNVDVRGKIIYIIMDVSSGVSTVDAQNMAIKALEKFTDEEKNFYDIQFTMTCNTSEEALSTYPMEGYKRAGNAQIMW